MAPSSILPSKASSSLRIVFQNINGLPIRSSNPKLDSLQAFINNNHVDVMGLSELNSVWHLIPTTSHLPALTAEWFESCHLGLAWNTNEHLLSPCQVGGVALLSTNQLAHKVISTGCDPTNLGCWTWTRYRGQQGLYLRIVSCYRPVFNAKGPLSAYNQHRRFFLTQHIDTCPPKRFLDDLQSHICEWQNEGDLLIVGGDWNDDTTTLDWQRYWTELGLTAVEALSGNVPQAT